MLAGDIHFFAYGNISSTVWSILIKWSEHNTCVIYFYIIDLKFVRINFCGKSIFTKNQKSKVYRSLQLQQIFIKYKMCKFLSTKIIFYSPYLFPYTIKVSTFFSSTQYTMKVGINILFSDICYRIQKI